MHLSEMLVLPTDPRTAARLLADPGYVREKVVASGATCEQVDVTHDGPMPDGAARDGAVRDAAPGAFTVTSRRLLPTEQIPPQVRTFVGNRIEVRQVEAWEAPDDEDARVGTVVVEVSGAPVRLAGRVTLVAHGPAATAIRYEGELRAGVPLFGAAVEEATAGAIRAALAAEAQVAQRRLA